MKKKGIKIINDCYNANFDSMKASIQVLSKMKEKRKIAILGDMLELGEYSKTLHEKVGDEIVKNKIDLLITVGKEAKNIAKQAIKQGMQKEKINQLENIEQAIKFIKNEIKIGDAILVKASNSMNFNKIVEALIIK